MARRIQSSQISVQRSLRTAEDLIKKRKTMKKTAKTLPKTIFQFPPGTRVGQFIEGDHRYVDYGTVKSNDPKKPNNVMVEFDQSAYSISAKMPPEIKSISIK